IFPLPDPQLAAEIHPGTPVSRLHRCPSGVRSAGNQGDPAREMQFLRPVEMHIAGLIPLTSEWSVPRGTSLRGACAGECRADLPRKGESPRFRRPEEPDKNPFRRIPEG